MTAIIVGIAVIAIVFLVAQAQRTPRGRDYGDSGFTGADTGFVEGIDRNAAGDEPASGDSSDSSDSSDGGDGGGGDGGGGDGGGD